MRNNRDEQLFRDAFSQIQVNTNSLERKVRENMNIRKVINPVPLKRTGFAMAASIAIMLLISGTVYAAVTLGVFERFIIEQDPAFGEVVTPIEISAIDQGIRIDVIAAQSFGYNAIMYLSVRDISGQNRITEHANLIPTLNIPRDDERFMGAAIMGGHEPLYFNKETNTAYFQIEFQETASIPNSIDIIINEIRFDMRRTEADFPVALSSITEASTIPNPQYFSNPEFPTWSAERILTPTRGESFPDLQGDGWISNVAIMNGHLHVQLVTPRGGMPEAGGGRNTHGTTISGAMLSTSDGEWVAPVNQTFLELDKNLRALSISEQQNMAINDRIDWASAFPYQLMEVVFPIDITALDSYSLELLGMFEHSIAGNWSVTIYTNESDEQVRSSTGTITMGYAVIESITVSPLGVSFSGSINGGISAGVSSLGGNSVSIETPAGNILIIENPSIGFSEMYGEDAVFNGFARAELPINVTEVSAVMLGDTRIVVE